MMNPWAIRSATVGVSLLVNFLTQLFAPPDLIPNIRIRLGIEEDKEQLLLEYIKEESGLETEERCLESRGVFEKMLSKGLDPMDMILGKNVYGVVEGHVSIAMDNFIQRTNIQSSLDSIYRKLDELEEKNKKLVKKIESLEKIVVQNISNLEKKLEVLDEKIDDVEKTLKTEIVKIRQEMDAFKINTNLRNKKVEDELEFRGVQFEKQKDAVTKQFASVEGKVDKVHRQQALRDTGMEKKFKEFEDLQNKFQEESDERFRKFQNEQRDWETKVQRSLHAEGIHMDEGDSFDFNLVIGLVVGSFMLLVFIIQLLHDRRAKKKMERGLRNIAKYYAQQREVSDEAYAERPAQAEEGEVNVEAYAAQVSSQRQEMKTNNPARKQRDHAQGSSEVQTVESGIPADQDRVHAHGSSMMPIALSSPEIPKIDFAAYSFQEGASQISHNQMLNSVLNRKEVKEVLQSSPTKEHILVKTVQDLVKVKSSKVAFFFFDHNERNRILEDKSDHGEKVRQRTLKMALQVSDAVIVIYCWDVKSKNLDLGKLFSPELEGSLDNPLLLQIRNDQSFYSIYKAFSYFQLRHIINKIKVCLGAESKSLVLKS